MAESKVNKENFITIQGWMITELNLKGNELIVYACIYGFSQAENQVFSGSLQYLADWTNSTKQSVIKCLKSLEEKGFIVKSEKYINGVKFCEYYATKFNTLLNKVDGGIKQSLTEGIKQSLPNNKESDNITENKIDNIEAPSPRQIIDLFNSICVSFPSVRSLSEARKKAIKARLNTYTIDDFRRCFEIAESSSFLKGGNDRNWTATFDWLIKDANLPKVLEGNYDNKAKSAAAPKYANFDPRAAFERAVARSYEEKEPPKTVAEDKDLRERAEALRRKIEAQG